MSSGVNLKRRNCYSSFCDSVGLEVEFKPTCLNSYALDEYYTLPNHCFQQVQEQPAPTIARVLNALNNRIGDFHNARSARIEFQNLHLLESGFIRETLRRVLKLREAANAHLDVAGRQ